MYKIFPIFIFEKKRKRKITIGLSEENLEKRHRIKFQIFTVLLYLQKL